MEANFGKYRLDRKLATGGMAEVFLAWQLGPGGFERKVALKRLLPNYSEDPNAVSMFLDEARIAAQLTHKNIVQIYDLGKIKDSYFIAMEYIPGRDMSAVIPKTKKTGIPFPVEYALKIASNVCEALYYAHTKTDAFGITSLTYW